MHAYTKIDTHTHILPQHIPNWAQKYGYGQFIWLQNHKPCCARMMKGDTFFREIEENCWGPEIRISEMDNTQVGQQVLSTVPVLFNYWAKPQHGADTSRFFNTHIAQCVQQNPTRFIGLGTVPMQDTNLAIAELEYCINTLKMPGIEIGSNINNANLGDAIFEPFWQKANELQCSIFVHPWDMMGEEHITKYWLPWLVGMPAETTRAICSLMFAGVFDRYPNIRFLFAHGGGTFAYTIGRIHHGHAVRPDLCAIDNPNSPYQYLQKFWVDSLVHDTTSFNLMMQTHGEHKICCGSDYPFPLGELNPPGKLIEDSNFAENIKQQLLYKNALDWLGMPH